MMDKSYLEDHFDYFVLPEYEIEALLKDKFNRKEGVFDATPYVKIIKVLNECFEAEVDVRDLLIEYLEEYILECETRLLDSKTYKSQLVNTDEMYDWKLTVENRNIAFLVGRINTLKLWIKEKTNIPVSLIDESGDLFNNINFFEQVTQAFSYMAGEDPRKHKAILSEDDFKKLINWVLFYFENDFKLPEKINPIKQVNTAKGNVIYTFKKLFKDLYPTATFPNTLFLLYKSCFYQYRDDKLENFLKQKEPQYYKELVKNSK